MGALEGAGDTKEKSFVGDAADELQANGQAVWGYTAGNGNGGEAGEVGRSIVAQEQSAGGMIRAADGGRFLTDGGRGNRSGGDDEGVEFGVGHSRMEASNERFALLQGAQIRGGGNLSAEFKARADILTIIGSMGRKPSLLLVIMCGFSQGDLIACVFGFVQQRDGAVPQIRA